MRKRPVNRVLRGGAYDGDTYDLRSTYRIAYVLRGGAFDGGFRIVVVRRKP